MNNLLFLRTGWMTKYEGEKGITNGGEFPTENGWGHELFNFKSYYGYVYGYSNVVPRINLKKLGAPSGDGYLDCATVVWFATHPNGGQYIVGWYENAEVYSTRKKYARTAPDNFKCPYYVRARKEYAYLIPEERRKNDRLRIPVAGSETIGFPHSRRFAWDPDPERSPAVGKFLKQVHRLLESDKRLIIKHRSRGNNKSDPSPPDPVENKKVEKAAEEVVRHFYKKYNPENVSKENKGWDLEVQKGKEKLIIEIKGRKANSLQVTLTAKEFQKSKKYKKKGYRIAIVPNALQANARPYIFKYFSQFNAWCEEKNPSMRLNIKPKVYAVLNCR